MFYPLLASHAELEAPYSLNFCHKICHFSKSSSTYSSSESCRGTFRTSTAPGRPPSCTGGLAGLRSTSRYGTEGFPYSFQSEIIMIRMFDFDKLHKSHLSFSWLYSGQFLFFFRGTKLSTDLNNTYLQLQCIKPTSD